MLFAEIAGGLSDLLIARIQMTFTLAFHICIACLGVGMPLLMLLAEWRFLRTGDELWRTLARRWSKAFLVLFAVGAVTGTVLSFELGLFWPNFMGTFGPVFALPFTLEGFAFFLEAIFAAIYLYGWDRLPPWVHWATGIPIAVAGCASAWFVVTVNAWMNCPQGFELVDGKAVNVDPVAAMLNPATPVMTAHMILAAYMVSGFVVASIYACHLLRNRDSLYCKRAMTLGLIVGGVCVLPQALVGDWAAKRVADPAVGQPVKLAAMEGQFETETGAPLRIGGIPDQEAQVTRFAIEVPGFLSFLSYNDFDAEVKGLKDFPVENWPPVAITHIAFQVMVGIGTLLMAIVLWAVLAAVFLRRLPRTRLFLAVLVLSGPLTLLSMLAGWVVTEVGRQPWIVQDHMRTADAVTEAPGIPEVFVFTILVYAIVGAGTVAALRLLAKAPVVEKNSGS